MRDGLLPPNTEPEHEIAAVKTLPADHNDDLDRFAGYRHALTLAHDPDWEILKAGKAQVK